MCLVSLSVRMVVGLLELVCITPRVLPGVTNL